MPIEQRSAVVRRAHRPDLFDKKLVPDLIGDPAPP
jgi:hypothetical protein